QRRAATGARLNPAMEAAFQAAVARDQNGLLSAVVTNVKANVKAETDAFEKAATDAGAAFAKRLLGEASPLEVERLRGLKGWQVPPDLDVRLLRFADDYLGGILWERPELKPTVRNAFWAELRKERSVVDDASP